MSVAVIEQLNKDHITISLGPHYRAVTFKLANGGAECVVLDNNATETTRFAIAPPRPGYVLEVNFVDGGVEIIYREVKGST